MTEPISPHVKGTSLELAVQAIETMILRESPSYSEKTFSIDTKKIVTVAGVRHEIDIWVSVDLGEGYTALFIFECKNWVDKVGKNDVIVFSEKIDAVQAQRGFFVAKSFTADAAAQAAKDPRVRLLRITDLSVDISIPGAFHAINIEGVDVWAHFLGPGATVDTKTQEPVDTSTAKLEVDGKATIAQDYVNEWALAERDKCVSGFPSQQAEEGVHELTFETERRFDAGKVTLNGMAIGGIRLIGKARVRVSKPRIISHFEVENRGRALTVVVDVAGAQVLAAFVARLPRRS